MEYRSSVHDTTGMTPEKLVFGRETHLPGELMFDSIPRATDVSLAIRKLTEKNKLFDMRTAKNNPWQNKNSV